MKKCDNYGDEKWDIFSVIVACFFKIPRRLERDWKNILLDKWIFKAEAAASQEAFPTRFSP